MAVPDKLRGLYAITDSQLLAGGKLLPYVEAALAGGARLLQYRDKSTDEARRLREAEALRGLCERYNAALIINDDAELAARLGVKLEEEITVAKLHLHSSYSRTGTKFVPIACRAERSRI